MKKIILNISFILVSIGTIAAILFLPIKKEADPEAINFSKDSSSISAMCELATVKSFYHNVAM